jgi:hypothetical protein
METQLAAKEYRFDSLVQTIVTRPQFLNQRISDAPEARLDQLQSRKAN